MHTFSTVLFVNGKPVGYTVFKHKDRVQLIPAESPDREINPPSLLARNHQGRWQVEGTDDRDLIEQVIEDMANISDKFPQIELSAAP